ncbi:hypothetical protein [Paenibacillus tengchongensis]|uniref:hypothetical protein n=1 Tax=Paenibacillus tengchongensis TaxID=2608684 RepID=UPI00124D03B1|nr:hypothetical protein [Paenibacillus tengchongensis]
MVSIKTWRFIAVLGGLVVTVSSCKFTENEPDASYREWRRNAEQALEGHTYILPAYVAGTGPLELVYDASSTVFKFELYRSAEYGITPELSGAHTVHDRYYFYAARDQKPTEAEILSGYGLDGEAKRERVNDRLTILNDNISMMKSGNITVYEIDEDARNVDNSERIAELLHGQADDSGTALIVGMEGRMNLAFYLPVGRETAEIGFTCDNLNELAKFLDGLIP